MRKILGIILAIIGCLALFAFLVLSMVASGYTIDASILGVTIAFIIVGWIYLTLWLLG